MTDLFHDRYAPTIRDLTLTTRNVGGSEDLDEPAVATPPTGTASDIYQLLTTAAKSWREPDWLDLKTAEEWVDLTRTPAPKPLLDVSIEEIVRGVHEYEAHDDALGDLPLILLESEDLAVTVASEVRTRFERLANEWLDDAAASSMVQEIVLHPAYQQIIGIGAQAIPLILERLRDRKEYWFWALAAIAGGDMAEGAEDEDEARNRWLEWGRTQGYLRPAE